MRELSGSGYLDPEVARLGFEAKLDLPSDASCDIDFDISAEIIAADYRTLSRRDVIDDCQAAYEASSCTAGDRAALRLQCYDLFVKLSPSLRKPAEECGLPSSPCASWESCINEQRPPQVVETRQPWYGRDFGSDMD